MNNVNKEDNFSEQSAMPSDDNKSAMHNKKGKRSAKCTIKWIFRGMVIGLLLVCIVLGSLIYSSDLNHRNFNPDMNKYYNEVVSGIESKYPSLNATDKKYLEDNIDRASYILGGGQIIIFSGEIYLKSAGLTNDIHYKYVFKYNSSYDVVYFDIFS